MIMSINYSVLWGCEIQSVWYVFGAASIVSTKIFVVPFFSKLHGRLRIRQGALRSNTHELNCDFQLPRLVFSKQ